MRLAVCFVLLAAAAHGGCESAEDPYPRVPGGGTTTPVDPRVDAAIDDPDAGAPGTALSGRVCLLGDPRDLSSCASAGAGDLTVTLGTKTATTSDDGTFAIERPEGSALTWVVTGDAVAPSLMPLSTTHHVPVLDVEVHDELLLGHGVLPDPERGVAFVRVVRGGQPLPGVTAQLSEIATAPARYDGVTPAAWTEIATGSFGMVWLAGVPAGTVHVTVTPSVGAPVTKALPIAAGAVTYATIDAP